MVDIFSFRNPDNRMSTYWSNFLKQPRSDINGWRIDYFLVTRALIDKIHILEILKDTIGSDHCPIFIDIHF